jgi:ankyrin repeat protein
MPNYKHLKLNKFKKISFSIDNIDADMYSTLELKFIQACLKNVSCEVKLFLDRGYDPNICYENTSIFLGVCALGHIETAKLLLDYGAYHYYEGMSCLATACEYNRFEMVKFLVEKGVDINYVDIEDDLETPLIKAVAFSDLETVKYLIDKGADYNYKDKKGRNCLVEAFFSDKRDIMKHLIKKVGMDVNFTDPLNNSLLIYAVINNKIRAVSDLIEYGADLNLLNKDNCSALTCSLVNKNINIVKLLLANGAKIRQHDIEFFKKIKDTLKENEKEKYQGILEILTI